MGELQRKLDAASLAQASLQGSVSPVCMCVCVCVCVSVCHTYIHTYIGERSVSACFFRDAGALWRFEQLGSCSGSSGP